MIRSDSFFNYLVRINPARALLTAGLLMSMLAHAESLKPSQPGERDISSGVCEEAFSKPALPKDASIINLDIEKYLWHRKDQDTMGAVRSKVSKEFDTTFYYTATGLPDQNKQIPFVDPAAKAVFVFFQGAGTGKASGRNFLHNMNLMAGLGFASVSFDYPYHADGPEDWSLAETEKFMIWIDDILKEVKKSNKPIYLVGHSFGPTVILEYLSRNPFSVQGALGMSPSNFDNVLRKYFQETTSQLNLEGRVPNIKGSKWSSGVSSGAGWMYQLFKDPTVVNKKLKLRILSGDEEEFVPSKLDAEGKPYGKNIYDISIPLQRLFANAEIVIEPGMGHKVFTHKDASGDNVVTREMLALLDLKPSQAKQLETVAKTKKDNRTIVQQVAVEYLLDEVFKTWVDDIYGKHRVFQIYRTNDDVTAKRMMDGYLAASKIMDSKITKIIIETQKTHPEFYETYKKVIENGAKKKELLKHLFGAYYNLVYEKNAEQDKTETP